MRICFIISNFNTKSIGNGGHYYSLISTALAMSKLIDISILNIGTHKSIALEDSNLPVTYIVNNNNNINTALSLMQSSREFFKNEKFNAIHAFDDLAYFFGRINSTKYKIPIVLTKCGGPNPKFYYPYSKNLILYSQENLNYFKDYTKFKKSNIHLIPNRINKISQDKSRVEKLINKYDLKSFDFVLLRIARIGKAYVESINQIIELKKNISKEFSVAVLIIGSIENSKIHDELLNRDIADLFIESDALYTKNASALISIADVVLGTGRSFMEASVCGKLMLAPIANSTIPVLVDFKNIEQFSNFNFSPRSIIENFSKISEIVKINQLLENKKKLNDYVLKNEILFKKNFQLSYVKEKYMILYGSLKYSKKINIFDFCFNFFFLLRKLYKI